MDAKITLSFDKKVIERAKKYSLNQSISLSRLTELLLDKITSKHFTDFEKMPLADWIHEISPGMPVYVRKQKSNSKIKASSGNVKSRNKS
jgi:hypothetical protein